MRSLKKEKKYNNLRTWEEKSGFLAFLSSVPAEVETFNESFGFDIHNLITNTTKIDGDKEKALRIGFVLERRNSLVPELSYCLYCLLKDEMLYGYIGLFKNGNIRTIKELDPIKDFHKGRTVLHGWLGQLVRASCEKIML
jgi:hypothetical protein